MRSRRFVVVALWASCFAAVAAGCGVSGDSVHGERLATFEAAGISFSYPVAWHRQHPSSSIGLRTDLIVGLSTQHLGSPCRRLGPRGMTFTCSPSNMLRALHRGGVLVVWTRSWTISGPTPLPDIGSRTRLGGRDARVVTGLTEPCSSIRATTGVSAFVDDGFAVYACARGIDSARFRSRIESMLRSLAFHASRV